MKENTIVSIIIPVYNTEKYLRQCLDSVLNQTFKDFECICINDCSTDNSYSVLEEYAKKDDRFVLINLAENKGQGNARNQGIKIAKGEYITFVDSDDWVTNDYVEVLFNAINKYNTDFVTTNFYIFDNITHKIKKRIFNSRLYYDTIIYEEKNKDLFLKNINNNVQSSTVCADIFKKDFFLSGNMLFNSSIKGEDTLFMWEAIIKAQSFIYIKKYLYYYRVNLENSTMALISVEDKMKYYNQLLLLSKNKFYKYLIFCYTEISLNCARRCEAFPMKQAESLFYLFKHYIYDQDYAIDYRGICFRDKIRLFVFKICLKYNLNYCFIGKLHRKFNPIRFFIKK